MRIMPCVAMELLTMFGTVFTSRGEVAVIPLAEIVVMVDVSIKAFGAVEPGSRADEHPVGKPLGAVITVRRAIIRRHFVVAIRTDWRRADADGNLCGRTVGAGE